MRLFTLGVLALAPLFVSAAPSRDSNPLVGRWDFDIAAAKGVRACWLGVVRKEGKLEVWYQPSGGNVFQVKDFKVEGAHLSFSPGPSVTWDLDAKGGRLIGTQKNGTATTALTGVRAPELKRPTPKAWTNPEPIFNGKDLTGWMPIGKPADSHWTVKDGLLVNQAHGANLRTKATFGDFKVHYEVNCPEDGNSGFYLRGRYEVQIEYEPLASNPPERRIGSIYGRIAPSKDLPRTPGKWDTFDVTLVGRMVTVVRNGVTIIDNQEIEGITGGAMDANEGSPGPFYIQGDHTGGLQFRNITVSVPKR